jgi:hypothetical protein
MKKFFQALTCCEFRASEILFKKNSPAVDFVLASAVTSTYNPLLSENGLSSFGFPPNLKTDSLALASACQNKKTSRRGGNLDDVRQ